MAPGLDGSATGSLYSDDGVSISLYASTDVQMQFDKGTLTVNRSFQLTNLVVALHKIARYFYISLGLLVQEGNGNNR